MKINWKYSKFHGEEKLNFESNPTFTRAFCGRISSNIAFGYCLNRKRNLILNQLRHGLEFSHDEVGMHLGLTNVGQDRISPHRRRAFIVTNQPISDRIMRSPTFR